MKIHKDNSILFFEKWSFLTTFQKTELLGKYLTFNCTLIFYLHYLKGVVNTESTLRGSIRFKKLRTPASHWKHTAGVLKLQPAGRIYLARSKMRPARYFCLTASQFLLSNNHMHIPFTIFWVVSDHSISLTKVCEEDLSAYLWGLEWVEKGFKWHSRRKHLLKILRICVVA